MAGIPETKAPPRPPGGGPRPSQLDRIEAVQVRLEVKLDALLKALAEDADEEDQQFDLDGNQMDAAERDPFESLG